MLPYLKNASGVRLCAPVLNVPCTGQSAEVDMATEQERMLIMWYVRKAHAQNMQRQKSTKHHTATRPGHLFKSQSLHPNFTVIPAQAMLATSQPGALHL